MKIFFFILLTSLTSVAAIKVLPPETGAYQGAYADFGATEDQVSEEKIDQFQALSGKKLAWAYFSNHWLNGVIQFPKEAVEICKKKNTIPYIRLSPWSEMEQSQKDKIFTMQVILEGKFDEPLRAWARDARDAKTAIMIEFGPEVNGDWFPWNGKWNGGSRADAYGDVHWPDGPERFRDAFRHLIRLFREEKADNITWVLHVDSNRSPEASWNDFKYYYPGDDYIDWIGVSVFGAQLPNQDWILFPQLFKNFWPEIIAATTSKPILISEYAVIEDKNDPLRKAQWIKQALESVSRGLFKQIKGVTYWQSPGWLEDKKANFMIDSSPAALQMYRMEVAQPFWLSDVILKTD